MLAVVKARAYGHGAVEVSKRLLRLGADMLGVALVEEGRELREAGIDAPILVMGATFPEQAEAIVSLKLTPAIFSLPVAQALSEAAYKRRTTINVHVKIDTGMGRIGIAPEDAADFIAALRKTQKYFSAGADDALCRCGPSGQTVRFETDGPLRGAS